MKYSEEERKILNVLMRNILASMDYPADFELGKKIGSFPYSYSMCLYKEAKNKWIIKINTPTEEEVEEYEDAIYDNLYSASIDFLGIFIEDVKERAKAIVKFITDLSEIDENINFKQIGTITKEEKEVIEEYKADLTNGDVEIDSPLSFDNTRICKYEDYPVINFYKLSNNYWGISISSDKQVVFETLVTGQNSILKVLELVTQFASSTFDEELEDTPKTRRKHQ